ncbi:MAG: hypothetical protein IT314_02585 [Anaerolineales bacterium]|nr:hypothetical protein [Anaerolineales bacterium]
MKVRMAFNCLFAAMIFLSACSPIGIGLTPSAASTQWAFSTITQTSEESLIGTEQAMAMTVQAEGALTRVVQSTYTPLPTPTSTPAYLPTLTPISNSTPMLKGFFLNVPPDVLGSRYEIENACYFDTQSGWERYEIYAGAISNSGNDYSAQGVVVVRIFQVTERDGSPNIVLSDSKEYLTLIKRGPLRLDMFDNCTADWMPLSTPLNFVWFLHPLSEEFYQYKVPPPLARLESGGTTQIAKLGSYCWNNNCADGGAIGTSSVPLTIQSSMTLYLRLPLDEAPDNLRMDVMLVSPPDLLVYDSNHDGHASWNYESPGRETVALGALPQKIEQEIELSLKPGYYVLMIFAAWRDYGSITYGFLIEVK